MKNLKEFFLWGVGIFFILIFAIYVKFIVIPSIMILIAGILLLPPINSEILNKLETDDRIKKYKYIRIITIVICFLVFITNVPVNEQQEGIINHSTIDTSVGLTMTEKNGEYTGERVDGKKEGNGTYKWKNGTVYEGKFTNDQISGKGKLKTSNKETYEGEFVNGKKNGKGIYNFANGDKYDGEWKDDKMEGSGTYTFNNGDKYVGKFSNNKFNGKGTYTKGKNTYTGTWKDNKYQK